MGRKSALEENGVKEGTKEYEVWIDKMYKLESKLHESHYRDLTTAKCLSICRILSDFEEAEFEFTIGSFDYKGLYKFLDTALNVLDLKFISSIVKSYTSIMEVNPISYGYKNDDINLIINSLEDMKRKINVTMQ